MMRTIVVQRASIGPGLRDRDCDRAPSAGSAAGRAAPIGIRRYVDALMFTGMSRRCAVRCGYSRGPADNAVGRVSSARHRRCLWRSLLTLRSADTRAVPHRGQRRRRISAARRKAARTHCFGRWRRVGCVARRPHVRRGAQPDRAGGAPRMRHTLFALAKRTVKHEGNDLSRRAGHTFACPIVPCLLEEHAFEIETSRSQIVILIDRGQRAAAGRVFKRVRHQRDRKTERLHRRFELARHSVVVGRCT